MSDSEQPPAKKRKKAVRVDLTKGAHLGKIVGQSKTHGLWRAVPGFDEGKVHVSSRGYVRVFSTKGGWGKPYKGSLDKGYYMVIVNGVQYPVHRLVCRAFHGPAPSAKQFVDHMGGDTLDNSAHKLEWVTTKENNQAERRSKEKKLRRTAQPLLLRKLDWPESRPSEWFAHAGEAADAYAEYGLRGDALGRVANYHAGFSTKKKTQHKGFVAEWAPVETQDDLQPGDDSNLQEPPPPAGDPLLAAFPEAGASTTVEAWRATPKEPTLWASTRGRVQRKIGKIWGLKYTPQPTKNQPYARIKYKGASIEVHTLVHLTFVGPIPEGKTMDHKVPSRKFDNRLVHLRTATRSVQQTNQDRKPISEREGSKKKAVWGKPVAADDWEKFESANEAGRQLHARFPDKAFYSGNISACANGRQLTAFDWVFEFDVDEDDTIPASEIDADAEDVAMALEQLLWKVECGLGA